jgi:DNA-binding CsgD family transcriptional regulator
MNQEPALRSVRATQPSADRPRRRPTAPSRMRFSRAAETEAAPPPTLFIGPEQPKPTLVANADGGAVPAVALREQAVTTERELSWALSNEEALETWTVLVEGRWALVDRFEKDGRRYLVARKNEGADGSRRSLSRREAQVAYLAAAGHSQKFIAYEIGLSQPSIARVLRGVLQYLGLQTRVDLVELYGHLATAARMKGQERPQ